MAFVVGLGMAPAYLRKLEDALAKAEEAFASGPIIGARSEEIHARLRMLLQDVTTERIRMEHTDAERQLTKIFAGEK